MKPCISLVILNRIPPPVREQFYAATATVSGEKHTACWRKFGPAVQLIYEDGDQGQIPVEMFSKGV